MQVHLIKTPDYPSESFTEIIDLLRTFEGPISFVSSQIEFERDEFFFLKRSIERSDLQGLEKNFYMAGRGMPLSWRELFSLCSYYREAARVQEQDFVVLLTERMNTMNWFSMIDGKRNVFVHCGDWELITDVSPKYPIAYEVMANVLRCLMKPDFEHPEQSFHEPPVGCMNDLCTQKANIILKLKTGDICGVCHQKLIDQQVHAQVIRQAFEVFDGIRKQFLFRTNHHNPDKVGPIVLNRNRRLLFPDQGNLELRLNPLEMCIYVFYLLHPEGVRLNELSGHRTELLRLYRRFSVYDDDQVIQSRINNLIDPFSNSFSEQKSRLNKKIKDLLKGGGKYYMIKGEPGAAFGIGLEEGLVRMYED